jgi:hypothetical protein
MSKFDNADLPPELSDVADRLRSSRYEASELELDQARTRILKRAGGQRAARGGGMHRRSFLTAAIVVGAIGTGAAGALAVGGSLPSLPGIGGHTASAVRAPVRSAALAMYGTNRTVTSVSCTGVLRPGQTPICTATVTSTLPPAPTGTVTFTSNMPGTFSPATCTLVQVTIVSSRCSVAYIPAVSGTHLITANYSGDAIYAPSTSVAPGVVVQP